MIDISQKHDKHIEDNIKTLGGIIRTIEAVISDEKLDDVQQQIATYKETLKKRDLNSN